jgi:uncharacterized Fe-S cluster-containing radical SAM superfamily protein
MRKELEPNIEIAEKLYPEIKELIEKYTEYCDENGNDENIEYKKLENKLHEITGKDISQYNLWEYWEEEGIEVLSFRISLPDPIIINNITKEELTEMIENINDKKRDKTNENKFVEEFKYYFDNYYHKLLKINFKNYKYEYFNKQKGKAGKYFEYNTDEIVEKIWNEK